VIVSFFVLNESTISVRFKKIKIKDLIINMHFSVGDVVYMKKPHPCGSYEWTLVRVGMDFKMTCKKCEHLVMISRPNFEKRFKKFISKAVVSDEF
jgi:hypothetical protein